MSEQFTLEMGSLAAKISIVLGLTLAATPLMRKQSAAARHFVLSMGILCAVSLPFVRAAVPSWGLPIGQTVWMPSTLRLDLPAGGRTTPAERAAQPMPNGINATDLTTSASTGGFDWPAVLLSTWMAGAVCVLFALGAGLMRLAWLSSRSVSVCAGPWLDASGTLGLTLGLKRVRLLQSRHPSLLVAWGWWRPSVLLPTVARTWQEDRIRAVLAHELAHLKRGDWPIQIAAELLRAACWFNPLVWITCRRLRRESEHACDDVVLSLGIDVASYANHLVDIARSLSRTSWLPAPAMARPSSLEGRVVAMLNKDLSRRPLTGPVRFATLLLLGLVTLPTASAQTFATLSGTVSDPTERTVPNVAIVLTNEGTRSTYTVNSSSAGSFEFVGLVPGTYQLQAMLPGFATLQGRVTLAAEDVRQDLRLEVGTLQETISVVTTPGVAPAPPEAGSPLERPRLSVNCQDASTGGVIIPPLKLTNQTPIYPSGASAAGVQGDVALEARVSQDGLVRDIRVTGNPPADLEAAAVDAVSQWEFTPTLLNCTPIEVGLSVTVKFALSR